MKLSWIGRSAIVVAGVIVVALVGLQVFYPDFFKVFNGYESYALLNLPLLVIASIGSINFLRNTKGMNTLYRSPWESYSWFVLGFTGGLLVYYLIYSFQHFIGDSKSNLVSVGSLVMLTSFAFIFIGLGSENYRATDKKVKDVIWVFIAVSTLLACVVFFTTLKNIVFFENLIYETILYLLPVYLCVSIIRKNDGHIRDIYRLILLSQIVFFIFLQCSNLMKNSMFAPLEITTIFLSFAILFDLRTSLYLSGEVTNISESESAKVIGAEVKQ